MLSLGSQATANTYTNHLELKLNGAYDGTNNKYITSAAFVNLDIVTSASNNSSGFDFYISQPGTPGSDITTSVATLSLRDNKANINTLLQFNNGTGNVQLNNISNSIGILAISNSGYNSIGEIEVTPDTSTTLRSYVRASSVYKPLYLAGSTISLSPSGTVQLTMDGSTVAVTVPFKMPNVTMASVTTYGGIWGKNVTPDITNYGVLVRDSGNDTYLQGLTSVNLNVAGVSRLLLNTTDITASLPLTVLNAKMGHSAYYSSSDWARFGHSAMDNAGGYGFMQYVDGQVLISAPTGKTASLSINNVGQVVCDGVNVNMSVPLILPTGLSQLKFGNGTCNIGCWTRNATDDSVQVSVGAAGVFTFACDTAIAGAAVLTTLQYNYVDWSTPTTTLQKFSFCRHTGGANTVATLPTGAAIGYETQICNTVNFTCGVQAGGAETIINAGGSPHYIPYNAVYRYLKISASAWVITAKSP